MIKKGQYDVYFSGFWGSSKYRALRKTNKSIFVKSQEGSIVCEGLMFKGKNSFIVDELKEMNDRYYKLNPVSLSSNRGLGCYVILV